MSPKRWILLLIFYISYLFFGASIYYHIEHKLEKKERANALKERIEINEYLVEQLADKNATTQNEILERITYYCDKPVTHYSTEEYETPFTWTFYHSFFFAFTVCSTVGYGNISPTTPEGRWIMIFYSIIGIPVNGILFAGLGDYFSRMFEAIYRRYKKFKMSRDVHYVPPQLGLVTIVAIALVPGVSIFLLLPAWAFSYFEDWSYSLSLYYSYVTTTTIGFGDYVPTFQSDQPRKFGGWFIVYEIFIIIWFIFSLGYLVMIMTFITRGLQSKKLLHLEKHLSTNIKATQNRIWNGVTKDVGYLRRILNELYILKVKPVYAEPSLGQLSYRSLSCPDLTMYRVDPVPMSHRKRATSECYGVVERRTEETYAIPLSSSDTELDRLDKTKSFETADAFRQTTDLLAKVVEALAAVRPPIEEDTTSESANLYGGYHGFSDSQILASEWSISCSEEPTKPRLRASSDFNIEPKWQGQPATMQSNEWTWSGDNNQIQKAITRRHKQRDRENLHRKSFGPPPTDYVVSVDDDEAKKPRVKKFSVPDGIRKMFPFKKRPSQEQGIDTLGADRKYSVVSVPEHRPPPMDFYGTVPAKDAGSKTSITNSVFPSDANIPTRFPANGGATVRIDAAYDPDQTLTSATGSAYQRNAAANVARKRRASAFAPNPALRERRASMFQPAPQRRGSLFSTIEQNRLAVGPGLPARRGSMFPATSRAYDRRPSLFSNASDENLDVLENTTLADLIRALEVVHTQAVLGEAATSSPRMTRPEMGGIFGLDCLERNSSLEPPEVPALLSLFAGDSSKSLNAAAAANRLYARRSTIVGTLPSTSLTVPGGSRTSIAATSTPNVLARRRPSGVQITDPPPVYTEKDSQAPSTSTSTSGLAKFKRRFSVRPTALQIPPGKAPPPGINITSVLTSTQSTLTAPPISISASQTSLQRRLSLRPSPLARELNISTQLPTISSPSESGPISPSGGSASSTTRLLPPSGGPRPSASTTYSPLSRIVQITQAQRKTSMPEGVALERERKSDEGGDKF